MEGLSDKTHNRLNFGFGKRLPLIRQREISECGLACLAMVASYHGYKADLSALSRQFPTSFKGTTLAQLIDAAEALGLVARPLKLELSEISKLQLPCVLHWDLNHFVVLSSVTRKGLMIHDPSAGRCLVHWSAANRKFTGVALEFSVGPSFKRVEPPPPVSLRGLTGPIQGLGKALSVVFALALVLEACALIPPQLVQIVVDQVLADNDRNLLTVLGASFFILVVAQTGVGALRTWTVIWLTMQFNLNWTGNVFQHLLKLPMSYYLRRHLGDVVSRFGAISVIQHTLTTEFVAVVIDGLLASMTVLVMIAYSPMLAGIAIAFLMAYGCIRLCYYHVYRESNLSEIQVVAKQQSHFMEAVRGVQTLRLYNQVAGRTARYLNATAEALNTSIAVQRLNLVFGSLNELVNGLQKALILWLGARLALGNQFSAGMLIAFIAYADQFSRRAYNLVDYGIKFKLLRLQGERLADIVLTAPERFTHGSYIGPPVAPSIQFRNVSFRYADSEPWIVHNCSFEIRPGESVAITGPSGCGKSTIARLMLGLLDPQQGAIYVGGIDLCKLGKQRFREMVGSVMQDDTLFAGTIADNICFHDESGAIDALEEAARMAALDEEISAMPMGYQSLVGDMGSALSGGQKQRLHLARALYKKPKLLILDEATAQLDVQNERMINDNIKSMRITRISIAHRIETLKSADRVLFLLHGKIFDEEGLQEAKKKMEI